MLVVPMILRKQRQSFASEPEDFDEVPAPAAKDKDAAGEGVLGERGLDQRTKPVHAAPHVGVTGSDPRCGRWKRGTSLGQTLQHDPKGNRVDGAVDFHGR